MNKKLFCIIFILVFVLFLAGCNGTPAIPIVEEDFIEITNVTPSSGLVDGQSTNFTVDVEYHLASNDTGILMIGFNNGNEQDMHSLISDASQIINKGTGDYTFHVTATAKDWGIQGDFKVFVNISEYPHPETWTPLAFDTYILSF